MRTTATTRTQTILIWMCLALMMSTGCIHSWRARAPSPRFNQSVPGVVCELTSLEIEYPDVQRCENLAVIDSLPPREMSDGIPTDFWEMPLEEAIDLALQNGKVLKDLGGRVLSTPQGVTTVFDPSIQQSHPRLGEQAALAAFDAQWAQAFTYREGTQVFNNQTLGGGSDNVNQDIFRAEQQLSKTAATGAQFQIRSFLEHDHNDIGIPPNMFSHVWTAGLEASMRQPLLRGSGIAFNRIAGPGSSVDLALTPGVVIARITGDITMADFERGVRDFVNEVETAYWQLYLAYQTLDANRTSRDSIRQTWQAVEARFEAGMEGGSADQEAQAREQVYFFEQQVLESLNGTPSGAPGVYQAERRLRRLLGLPVNDGQLIRPLDAPTEARVVFDWDACVADALVRRVELRQQMWRVRQRELEVVAAKNFLLPQLDAVATYRATGLGDDLSGGPSPSALADLWQFNNDQVEAGLQLNIPIGFRRELAGVRHAELNLCRERAVLHDQEHAITHALAEALVSLRTAHESILLNRSRMQAAEDAVNSQLAVFEAGRLQINFLLEAQRRLADARTNYYSSLVQHSLALLALHREKGTLLGYSGIMLNEGNWCRLACVSHEQYQRRFKHKMVDYRYRIPGPVSAGPVSHAMDAANASREPHVESAQTQPYIEPLLPQDLMTSEELPTEALEWSDDIEALPSFEPGPQIDTAPRFDSEFPSPSSEPLPEVDSTDPFQDEVSSEYPDSAESRIPAAAPISSSRPVTPSASGRPSQEIDLTSWGAPVADVSAARKYPEQTSGCIVPE